MLNTYFLIDSSSNTITNVFSWNGDIDNYVVPDGFFVKQRTFDSGWINSFWNGVKAIEPRPYPSWILDTNNETWVSPVPKPNDGKDYQWNEETSSWKEIITPKFVDSIVLSKVQVRLGLLSAGVSPADVDSIIEQIPDPTEKLQAKIYWNDSVTYRRTHPLVNTIGFALGLTTEQIDQMWIASKEIE
jgi:hypothetical protein